MIGCFMDCFYEGDDSECLVKTFKKPKDGMCGGEIRCPFCGDKITEEQFNNDECVCKHCIKVMKDGGIVSN